MHESIPEKCQKCPFIIDGYAQIEAFRHDMHGKAELAMSEFPEQIAELISSHSTEFPGLVPDGATTEQIAAMMRMGAGRTIEAEDEFLQESEKRLLEHSARCLGALTLRGSRDGRRVYEVTVCASPAMPPAATETASVKRTKIT